MNDPTATLQLWDYRRRVAGLYTTVRTMDPRAGWERWITTRDDLFRNHLQSPIPVDDRADFPGLDHWPYDPGLRVMATVAPRSGAHLRLAHSGDGVTTARVFGAASFRIAGVEHSLDLYWLDDYGGGALLPFRDPTNGTSTDGGGRYLLDTAKGADLGHDGHHLVLDFNFAYHPSCAHDSRWSCPLAPRENALSVPIEAGERLIAG